MPGIKPTLPSEIYGVIAEFLAGMHAFGTLSRLNIVNHGVHEETLPVLFETVLMDKPPGTSPFERGKSLLDEIPASRGCLYTR